MGKRKHDPNDQTIVQKLYKPTIPPRVVKETLHLNDIDVLRTRDDLRAAVEERDDVVARMNKVHAEVTGRVYLLECDEEGRLIPQRLTREEFRIMYANEFVKRYEGESVKHVTADQHWLESDHRRWYKRIVFRPGGGEDKRELNTFTGFKYQPGEHGSCKLAMEFLESIGGADRDYLLAHIAHLLKHPGDPARIALVVRGDPASGKEWLGRVIAEMIGKSYYYEADNPGHVLDKHNVLVESTLVTQVNAAALGGNDRDMAALIQKLTAQTLTINPKNDRIYRADNYNLLIILLGKDGTVPVMTGEWRVAVFDVGDGWRGGDAKSKAMLAELRKDNGSGARRLMHELSNDPNIASVDVHKPPATAARNRFFVDQFPMHTFARFWFECLWAGSQTYGGNWIVGVFPKKKIWDEAYDFWKRHWVRDVRPSPKVMGKELSRLLRPFLDETKPLMDEEDERGRRTRKQVHCFIFPTLAEARAAFKKATGLDIDWPKDAG